MVAQSDADESTWLLASMLVIRRTEEEIIQLGHKGLIGGLYFVSIGQEAVAVAVTEAMHPDDVLFTTHRNHAHLLARGVPPTALIAEILGRATGTNGGRGGGYHPVAPELGILHTSSIVGSSLSLAAGAALAIKRVLPGGAAIAFIGEGVFEQGVAYETLNIAALQRLPLLVVCEDNSVTDTAGMPGNSTLGVRSVSEIAKLFGIPSRVVEARDVREIVSVVSDMMAAIRAGTGPKFLEARVRRWPGSFSRQPALYPGGTDLRSAWTNTAASDDLLDWNSQDPILVEAERLLSTGRATPESLSRLDGQIRVLAREAAAAAEAAPWPQGETAFEHVFAEPGTEA